MVISSFRGGVSLFLPYVFFCVAPKAGGMPFLIFYLSNIMKKKHYERLGIAVWALYLWAFTGLVSQAQNLVPNPGFENANCPIGYTGWPAQVSLYMQDWYSATCASPDVMGECGNHANTRVPNILRGYQYPRTGQNFAGFGFYSVWYEYLGVKLTQPLVAGTEYRVSFYASPANSVKYATDALGIYFSTTEIRCTSGFSGPVLSAYTPQVRQTPGVFLNDTLGWQQVSGTFVAQGGEEYIVVGYFNPWDPADFEVLPGADDALCYYYVDDFSVEAVVPVPNQPGAISGLQTVCRGSTQTFSVSAVPGATSYTWTLPNGWTGTSTTNNISVTVGPNAGTVSVTADNASGSSQPQTLSINVNPLPGQPGSVTGPTNVCAGSTVTYSVTPVTNADTYFWILPSGWIGSSNTTSITVQVGSAGGVLTAGAQNQCGTSGTQATITVPVPDVSVSQTNNQLFAVSGADAYQWLDCDANHAEIPGATQVGFVPTVSGSYAVAVTLQGCTDTSACRAVTVTPAGLGNLAGLPGVSVFPNPARQFLQITWPDAQAVQPDISVSDLNGRTVYRTQSNTVNNTVMLTLPADLATGIYLLEIREGDRFSRHKIVLEK